MKNSNDGKKIITKNFSENVKRYFFLNPNSRYITRWKGEFFRSIKKRRWSVKMPGVENRIVLLLSGGLDTTTLCALAHQQDKEIHAVTIDYGQRNIQEINSAIRTAKKYKCAEHILLNAPYQKIGGSSITDLDMPVDQSETAGYINKIPSSYVPARNIVFLSIALGAAETRNCSEIWIGANKSDYKGYPDCRPEFLRAFEKAAMYGTKDGVTGKAVKIVAPLINMVKSEIVHVASYMGVDFKDTVSCYKPDENGKACGKCEACRIRKMAFQKAGITDSTLYYDE